MASVRPELFCSDSKDAKIDVQPTIETTPEIIQEETDPPSADPEV